MPNAQNVNRPRAARGADTESIKTRTDRSGVVGATGPNGALWAVPAVKDAGTVLVAAGTNLSAGEQLVNNLLAQLRTARKNLIGLTLTWDAAHGVFVTNVEANAKVPADITGSGLLLADRTPHLLEPPMGLLAMFDLKKSLIRATVQRPAPGKQMCLVEISPDPVGPATFKALKGYGARRTLSGYAPGTWWLRAALVDAGDQSDYFGPVSVIVK